ncbi:MAG: GNAT family N-acetyltransferase [Tetrasphaera sp.]
MTTTAPPDEVRIRPAGVPGDLGWVVMEHGRMYADEYGWDITFEALVAQIMADFGRDPQRAGQAGWIADVNGERAGCIFCVPGDEPGTAQLRTLLVTPAARGRGVGGQLIEHCADFARAAGFRRLTLWTNDVLVSARRLYEEAGFTLTEEDRHHSFGQDLVGQRWSLRL